jgi:sigma-B regulation protein RsbU (phosphoserine phosphatase)
LNTSPETQADGRNLELAARVQHSVLPSRRLRYGDYFSDWLFLPSAWIAAPTP